MAKASTSMCQDEFSCPVCLDLLDDPVTTPCGHHFCMSCISICWDQEAMNEVYSCLQCKKTFTTRPDLRRNDMLAKEVENLKKLQPASSGPGYVKCDFCIESNHKATKSCLMCLASYCEEHLQPHYQSPALKKHKLVEACADLQERICSQHSNLIDIYCRTDRNFICYLCWMNEHKDHDTVLINDEVMEKQNELKKFQKRVQKKRNMVRKLKNIINILKRSSQGAEDDNERIFHELISLMQKRRSEVTELIRAQKTSQLRQARNLLKKLKQEINDFNSSVSELEQLSDTHSHISFLQSFPSLCVSPGCNDSPSFTVNQYLSFDEVRKSVSDLQKQVMKICQKELNKIRPQENDSSLCSSSYNPIAAAVQMILLPEERNREDFLQYFIHLTLDPNTAHHQLLLSEENRVVTRERTTQRYSDHPERFDSRPQVLCKERVCGRCYWEVEWSGMGVSISVSYKDICRKGGVEESEFGYEKQSLSLWCSPSSVSFWHNGIPTELVIPASSRIGVYVDHCTGTLSFYSITGTMRLLHRVHTTFTQPLYPGFRVCHFYSTVRLCGPNVSKIVKEEKM
ncbi:finTRIM family, member 14 [Silurus meridionalis]|nr:finTRIM family, member 14 [Silurus meridionalis]